MQFTKVLKLVERFARSHQKQLRQVDFVVGVSRGGLIPAALIATRLDKPLITIYIDRQGRVYLDRRIWLRGKRVLLVDDIVRTGSTLQKMLVLLKKSSAREVKSFTLFCLRGARARPTWTTLISRNQKMPWDF